VHSGGGGEGGGHVPRAALSRGQHFKKDKKVSLCTVILMLYSTQMCSVTLKMLRIHFRPGLHPRRTLKSGELVGWDLGQGGAARRKFSPRAPVTRAATESANARQIAIS